jgi:MFS family permease
MFKSIIGINKVVRYLVVTDFFLNSAFGSFAPIFAIFVTNQIAGGSARVAGFAASAYWITKSIVQLPIARFLDRTDGERDDFWAMFFGFFVSGFVPFAYIFITTPLQLYITEAIHGLVMAWAVPAWYAIFTRHVDRWGISFEWSLQSVFAVGLATAISAAVGGYVADTFGFNVLFASAGVIAVLFSFLLLPIRNEMFPRRKNMERVMPEHQHRRGAYHHHR